VGLEKSMVLKLTMLRYLGWVVAPGALAALQSPLGTLVTDEPWDASVRWCLLWAWAKAPLAKRAIGDAAAARMHAVCCSGRKA